MILTAPYRWFYLIVHTCCFCAWKGFNKYFTICVQFFGHFPSIKCFTILSPMANIDFSFFCTFGLSFLGSPAIIVFLWVTTTIQRSYDCHVLVDLLRCIFLLFILLAFFFFIAEASWSVFILAFLAVNGFCVL